MESEEDREAGLTFSHILDVLGFNNNRHKKFHSKLIHEYNCIGGLIRDEVTENDECYYIGSFAEGLYRFSIVNGTTCDLDVMNVCRECVVVEDNDVYNGESSVSFPLQMELCETNSGYVRLKIIDEEPGILSPLPLRLQNVVVNDNSKYYLANSITAKVKNTMGTAFSNELNIPGVLSDSMITGPSVAQVTAGGFKPGTFAIDKIDTVISIPCAKWPTVAKEWIYRKREHGWPSLDFISEHVRRRCHVVPVGCKECSRQHLDWRLSFVLVEKELVLDFNPTQFQCLLLLKHLKKFNLEKEIGDIISSYILKTVLFWVIEESPPALWVPHRLLTAVHRCLDRVIECVQNEFCPNYFIRTCNLLAKRCNEIEKQNVLRICRSVRTNTSELLLKSQPFKEIIQTYSKDMLSVLSVLGNSINTKKIPSMLFWKYKIKFGNSLRGILSCQESLQTAIEHCCKGPEKLRRACMMKDFPLEEVAEVCTEMELIRRRLLWTKDILNEDRKANIMCIEVSQSRLRETDALMENISICHMNAVAGKFYLCNEMIKPIISTAKMLPNVRMHFPAANWLFDGQMKDGFLYTLLKTLVKLFANMTYLPDIVFLKFEVSLLPAPLQMEMYSPEQHLSSSSSSQSPVTVDPVVYACFLKFWCCMKLERNIEMLKARDDMVWCCGLPHITNKAVAFNLLGYCHKQLEEYEAAFRAFCKALEQNPRSKATPVHICVLVNSVIQRTDTNTSQGLKYVAAKLKTLCSTTDEQNEIFRKGIE